MLPSNQEEEPSTSENKSKQPKRPLTETSKYELSVKRFAGTETRKFPKASSELVLQTQCIDPYRGPSPVVIADWLQTFKTMPTETQSEALRELVEFCSPSNVKHLQKFIAPHFQKDFISLLPKELSLKIINFLLPLDLMHAALSCKYWRSIAEDPLIWTEKCHQDGIKEMFPPLLNRQESWGAINCRISPTSDPLLPIPVLLYSRSSFSTKGILDEAGPSHYMPFSMEQRRCRNKNAISKPELRNSDQETNLDCCYRRSKWKAIYMRAQRIRNNWRRRRLTAACQLRGHDEHVITCLKIHGNIIVTGSDDNSVRVWSAATAECLHVLSAHNGGVWCLEITGELIYTLVGHTSTVRCMARKQDILVSGSRDCTVRVWNIRDGCCLRTLYGHIAAVRCVQFDGCRIVSGGYDHRIIVWDVASGDQIHVLEGHTNRVYSLLDRMFISSHRIWAGYITSAHTCDNDWKILYLYVKFSVWNAENGECVQTLIGHTSLTSGMQLRGNILVSANADSTIKVWDVYEGHCLHTLAGPHRHSSAVTSLQMVEDGMVVTSGDDGTVKLWDIKQGAFICDLVKLESSGKGGCVWRVKATPTMLVCAVGSRNGTEDTKLILLDFDAPYP
ncbi:WD domain, g-beta repeat domain-containing protein [Ditylenchus destructor]|nr:WD domain, g-beta repeat domain-containing protein [Ditylenchus destructor]